MTTLEKVIANIEKSESGCWVWRKSLSRQGYGQLFVDGKNNYAHRLAYQLLVGPIPDGMTLDHLCRNRGCVNPKHLQVVTLAENKARGMSIAAINARKTHCKHGHEFTQANTVIEGKGRKCRACSRLRQLAKKIANFHPKTHCKRGHLYTSETVRITSTGSRQCLPCKSIVAKAYWEQLKRKIA